MVLVFILLGILIFLLIILSMILFSYLKIDIKKLSMSNTQLQKNKNYNITISLYLFNRFKWLFFSFDREKVKRIFGKIQLEKIDFEKFEQDLKLKDLKYITKLQPKICYLDLQVNFGLESPVITAFTVSAISSLISILLPHIAKKVENKSYKYNIVPIYQNKNLYKIKLKCIIELKIVHIINVIYIFIKKGRSDKNEPRTSNRKSYGYSYE